MSNRSATMPRLNLQPSQAALLYGKLAIDLHELHLFLRNHVAEGMVLAPTSANTQGAGGGNLTWRCNISGLMCTVNGIIVSIPAQADFSIHAGSALMALNGGCVAAIVAYNSACLAVKGTVAAVAANAVGPTDAVIQAAVDAAAAVVGTQWIKLGEISIARTLDTTVVAAYNNARRPALAINEDTTFADFSGYTIL